MTSPRTTSSDPQAAQALAPICPLCHTFDQTVTPDALVRGASWICVTCGQRWSASRLERMAAYARYQAAH
jgi:hypothetical protein